MTDLTMEAVRLMELLPKADQEFACAFLRRMAFPFESELPNAETIQAIADAQNGVNMIGPFDTVDDLMEALNAPD